MNLEYIYQSAFRLPEDSVFTMLHALRHYRYLIELIYVKLLINVFVKKHKDFQLEDYLIKLNG